MEQLKEKHEGAEERLKATLSNLLTKLGRKIDILSIYIFLRWELLMTY